MLERVSGPHSCFWLSNAIPRYGETTFACPFTCWWASGLFLPFDCCEYERPRKSIWFSVFGSSETQLHK